MKRRTFSPAQIAGILKEFDNGKTAEEITWAHGVSKASLYKWRQRYGGMEATELKRIFFNQNSFNKFWFWNQNSCLIMELGLYKKTVHLFYYSSIGVLWF